MYIYILFDSLNIIKFLKKGLLNLNYFKQQQKKFCASFFLVKTEIQEFILEPKKDLKHKISYSQINILLMAKESSFIFHFLRECCYSCKSS